jgi:aminoglycoside 6'-N-acetyltransferase
MLLRPVEARDAEALRSIRASETVARWWDDPEDDFPLADDPEATRLTIEVDGAVAGMVQYAEELDPKYRHASVDIFLDPAFRGRGIGAEAVRQVVVGLIDERGHHRITIDPAAGNEAAIRAYTKVGFRTVGVLRSYERDRDGRGWHDGLMMDLLAGEEARTPLDDAAQR